LRERRHLNGIRKRQAGGIADRVHRDCDARGFAGPAAGSNQRSTWTTKKRQATIMVGKVALLYAGLNGALFLALSWRVVRLRRRYGVGIGYNGKQDLNRAIRVHANFGEYVPLALILLLGLEVGGLAGWALHVLGGTLLAGRLLHAYGLGRESGRSPGRSLGTGLTWLMIGVSAVLGIGLWLGDLP
jgi:uncharacterized membrane protein YecN with MAPEG domain